MTFFERKIWSTLRQVQEMLLEPGPEIKTGLMRRAFYLAPGRYRYLDRSGFAAKFPFFAGAGETLFFRAGVVMPRTPGNRHLLLQAGFYNAEGLLSLDGKPWAGLDRNHKLVELPPGWRPGSRHELEVEFQFIARPDWTYNPDQARTFLGLRLVFVSPEVLDYHQNLKAVNDAWEAAEPGEKERLAAVLEESFRSLELEPESPEFLTGANRVLRRFLETGRAAPGFEVGLLGHSHLDTAYLWPMRETIRKCGRTFSTALRLMESDPDFIFGHSQPVQYRFCREHYPELYRQVKARIAEGRWEPLGGLWVEPDCNLTAGESLVRQVIQGSRFWREEFGTASPIAWLPDVFGFNGALPQILKGAGIDYFFTVKLYWNVASRFPHTLFWWEGIDGTRVLAHVPYLKGGYSGFPGAADLRRARAECRHAETYPATLFPMGHGDGGGGVTPEMLETARRYRDFPGLPRTRFVRAADFFKAAERRAAGLPVWRGELYYETHQGCYTSQAFIKRSNRRLEEALAELEMLRSLGALRSGRRAGSGLDETWREVLTYQFHDILPGTSVPEAYAEIEPRCRELLFGLRRSIASELGKLAPAGGRQGRRDRPAFLVFNTLNWPRREVVELEPGRPVELDLPAGGYLVTGGSDGRPARSGERPRVSPTRLENRFFRLELDRRGRLVRLYDRVNRREVLAEGAAGNDFRIFREAPVHYEAWDIDADYEATGRPFGRLLRRRVLEAGPVRAAVRQEFSDGRSRLVQDIIIYAGLPRIDFRTEVDWQERRRMLKVAFPLALEAGEAWYEIPFGAIARPAVPAGPEGAFRREVSGHHWADVSAAGYGVALLNDSKYGYDFDGRTLRLTLLRAPMYPNPDADRGRHRFTYALYPHAGRWPEAGVVEAGFSLNRPPLVHSLAGPRPGGGAPVSLFRTEGLPVVISAFKPAEDGQGFVIRLYEPAGRSGRVKLCLPAAPAAAWETNLLEEARRPVGHDGTSLSFEVRPFEIKTFYFSFEKEKGGPGGRKKS